MSVPELAPADAEWLQHHATPALLAHWCTGGSFKLYRHTLAIGRAFADCALTPNGRLIVSIPPQRGKSLGVSVWGPIWYLDMFPEHEVLVASYGDELRQRIGREMRNLIRRYPDRLSLRLTPDSQAAHRFDTPQGGGLFATTVRSELSGYPGHLIVIDDPYKDWAQAHSPLVRGQVSDWFKTVALMRTQAETSIVVATTRYHEEDLSGELEADVESPYPWKILRIPALAEANPEQPDPLGREPGEVIEEAQHPAVLVRETIRVLGAYKASSIMGQRPAPLEGGMFKKTQWVYAAPPPDKALLRVVRVWDLAYSESEGSDWTVGALMANWRQQTFVLELVREQLEPSPLKDLLKATARADALRWGRKVTQLFEQEPAGGKMLAHTVTTDWLAGYKTHVDKPQGDKTLRAIPLAGAQGERAVVLSQLRRADGSLVDQDWAELVEEHAVFPGQGANDDIVDALSHGYTWLTEAAPSKMRTTTTAGRRLPG